MQRFNLKIFMKTQAFSRYERDSEGRFLIDVAADGVEELYNHWDHNAPYIRRDLDRELTDYLIDSAEELERASIAIQFSFHRNVDTDSLVRVTKSINVFFHYLADKEARRINRMLSKSALLLITGLVVLSIAVWISEWVGLERTVLEDIFAQGLTIAAWVALWEALATFLIEWYPQRKQVKLYRKLADAPLSFRSVPGSTAS